MYIYIYIYMCTDLPQVLTQEAHVGLQGCVGFQGILEKHMEMDKEH